MSGLVPSIHVSKCESNQKMCTVGHQAAGGSRAASFGINSLKADRDRAKAAFEAAKVQIAPAIRIDPALIEQFGRGMREKFSTGSVPFRKAYLQSLFDLVEVRPGPPAG
jgi:hypothetical protein